MFSIQHPEMLFLLFTIPLIIILHLVSLIYFSKKAFKFANFETLKRLNDGKRIFSRRIPELIIRIIFVIILILAASGLTYSYRIIGFSDEVMIAIDSSGSMLSNDIPPFNTRLDAVKSSVSMFIDNMSSGMRLGIISFTSTANVIQRPIYDKRQILPSINNIQVKTSKGTSIGEAINYAGAVFISGPENEKQLIIITDGQENVLSSEELIQVLDKAKKDNIKINMIGVGTETGASFKEELSGSSVLNEKTLKDVADDAGGRYALANNQDDIVNALNIYIEKREVTREFDLTLYLFMLSFIILLIEWYLSNYLFSSFP
jgi:Ca-activated chloride channel family protein